MRVESPALICATVLLVAAAIEAPASRAGSRMVDVGGHRLRLYCSGRGAPTVILDSGAGDSHRTWSEVQAPIAEFTRVCSYDRAGLGASDLGPLPRTSSRIVDELLTLMREAGIDGPVVLVGHSFGGLNVQLLARRHPESVAGLVLVDATHEDYSEESLALLTRAEKSKRKTLAGVLPPTVRSELESLEASGRQLRAAPPFDGVPTIVISAGMRNEPVPMSELWQRLQAEIAASTHALRHVIAEESGHNVPFDQPELVIQAVRELVDAVRGELAQGC